MRREPLRNRDIRFFCMENGVKFCQIALQFGISPETFTRRMRNELNPEEKKKIYRAIECVQKVLGYGLSGDTRFECMFIF